MTGKGDGQSCREGYSGDRDDETLSLIVDFEAISYQGLQRVDSQGNKTRS